MTLEVHALRPLFENVGDLRVSSSIVLNGMDHGETELPFRQVLTETLVLTVLKSRGGRGYIRVSNEYPSLNAYVLQQDM